MRPTGAKKRVVVGMSGGVDSSVTAWLLKEQGYEVIGLFMKNWEEDDDSEYCSTRQDWLDAASVADVVGVDIEAVNFAAEYKDRVFDLWLSLQRACVRVGGVTYPKKSFRHRRLTWVPHKLRVLLGRVLSFRHELPLPKSESLLLCVHTRTCVVGRRSLEVGLGRNRDGSLSAPARCSAERTTAAQPVLCHISGHMLCQRKTA